MKKQNKKIIFWGTPEFAVPSLDTLNKLGLVSLVISQPDRPSGRGKKILVSPVKKYCQEKNIPFLTPEKLDSQFVKDLQDYRPATFVVVAYGKIISQEVLDLSELASLNIHPSMLPILRGPSPIQSALLKGLSFTGVSLMQLDEKMDHGPILSQIEVKIDENDEYISLSKCLSNVGAQLLENNILDYLDAKIEAIIQDDSKATYCKLIKKEDGLIDWTKGAVDIHNKVRAYKFWPSAYTKLDNLDIKILKTEIVDKKLSPGKIIYTKDELFAGTGDKSLKILELQVAGKSAMGASEFIRGYQKYLDKNFE